MLAICSDGSLELHDTGSDCNGCLNASLERRSMNDDLVLSLLVGARGRVSTLFGCYPFGGLCLPAVGQFDRASLFVPLVSGMEYACNLIAQSL